MEPQKEPCALCGEIKTGTTWVEIGSFGTKITFCSIEHWTAWIKKVARSGRIPVRKSARKKKGGASA